MQIRSLLITGNSYRDLAKYVICLLIESNHPMTFHLSCMLHQYCCTIDSVLTVCQSHDRVGDRLMHGSRILDVFHPQSREVDLYADQLIRENMR